MPDNFDNKTGGFGGVSIKPAQPTLPSPPNENLTAALRATLRVVENEPLDNDIPSPLTEATPDSIDILLNRINNHLIAGKILSDLDLRQTIDIYRSQALRYAQEQQTKKPRAKNNTPKQTIKQILDLELEL